MPISDIGLLSRIQLAPLLRNSLVPVFRIERVVTYAARDQQDTLEVQIQSVPPIVRWDREETPETIQALHLRNSIAQPSTSEPECRELETWTLKSFGHHYFIPSPPGVIPSPVTWPRAPAHHVSVVRAAYPSSTVFGPLTLLVDAVSTLESSVLE